MAEILKQFLTAAATQQLVYGSHDCATFVLDWLDLMTGKNTRAKWAGRYDDEASCTAFIAAGGGFEAIASDFFVSHYGIGRAAAKPGNVVYGRFREIAAMGVRIDAARVAFRTSQGVIVVREPEVLAEWGLA